MSSPDAAVHDPLYLAVFPACVAEKPVAYRPYTQWLASPDVYSTTTVYAVESDSVILFAPVKVKSSHA
jgi:hypothetical protein